MICILHIQTIKLYSFIIHVYIIFSDNHNFVLSYDILTLTEGIFVIHLKTSKQQKAAGNIEIKSCPRSHKLIWIWSLSRVPSFSGAVHSGFKVQAFLILFPILILEFWQNGRNIKKMAHCFLWSTLYLVRIYGRCYLRIVPSQ